MSRGKTGRREHIFPSTDAVDGLIRQLAQIEASIQALMAGQVDAVVDPTNGMPIMLRQAQAALYRANAALEQRVQQRTAELEATNQALRQEIAERQRLQESLQHHVDRLHILQRLDGIILAAHSAEEMAEAALGDIREFVSCRRVSLVTFDFEANRAIVLAVSTHRETRLGKGTYIGPDDWPIEELRQGKTCLVRDSQLLSSNPLLLQMLQEEDIQAAIYVPLRIQAELIGVLNLGLGSPLPADFEPVDILQEIADHLAVGLHQAHLAEELRRHTVGLERLIHERTTAWRESEARFQRLAERTPDVIYRYRLKPTLGFEYISPAVTATSGYTPSEFYADPDLIFKLVHPDDRRQLVALQQASSLSNQPVFLRWVRQDGRVIWTEQRNVAVCDDQGNILIVEGIARDITERKQTEAEKERLFEEVNRQREQLRALTRQLAQAQEIERKELSWELHDRVGSKLTALNLNLTVIETQLAETALRTTGSIQARLADSMNLTAEIASHIRDVMAFLRPPVLDDFGLVAALHWYCHQLAPRVAFTMAVQGEEPVPRLASPVENALFRVAQEALTNVAKYAQAATVTLTVRVDEQAVRLIIFDDGVGFEPARRADRPEKQGWGLITMVERVETVGGSCRINSRPGQGTQIIVEVPR